MAKAFSVRNFVLPVVLLAISGPVFAHAHLDSATPAMKGRVATSPSKLVLHFTEGVNLSFTGAAVKAADGNQVATGKPRLKSGDDQTLIVPFSKPLPAGQYKVVWHALAKDGHKTEGTYRFTVTSQSAD